MPSGEPRIAVSTLRDAVRDAIGRTSSRAVSRALGISPPAVREFAGGAEPRNATIRKLTAWYIREREQRSDPSLDAETAAAAIALLLEHIPARDRDEVRAALIGLIDSEGKRRGVTAPAWMSELRGSSSAK